MTGFLPLLLALAASAPAAQDIDIIHVDAGLRVTPAEEISGRQTLSFRVSRPVREITFDTGELTIAAATIDGRPVAGWDRGETGLTFHFAETVSPDTEARLSVTYAATSPRGVSNTDGLLYTAYFACDWMVCNQNDFADRFTMVLALDVPAGMATLGPGRRIGTGRSGQEPGRRVARWETEAPFPAYVHAFAAGNLDRQTMSSPCAPTLGILAPEVSDKVRQSFASTCAMVEFFEEKAGTAFPADQYDQLYVPGSRAAQEAVSHSIIGGIFLDPILDDPQEDWVIAHELAHQWWGNRVTAADLSHFWLNEGIVTFMVAGWKEHRWGREAYDREIALNRRRWEGRIAEAGDVPLAHPGPWRSLGARRSIQYAKGAVFLHELRDVMGDGPFWSGLAAFTSQNMGRAVTSRTFFDTMQGASEEDLAPVFSAWVFPE